MATQSAVFTFALPEDTDSDQLLIKSSTTKDGTYSTDATVSYEYGDTTYEYDSLDDTKWYKIQFNNSTDSETSPDSEAVYGGDFDKSKLFLAVSSLYDGANFASTQDVLDYSNLTLSDVTSGDVSTALRRARAVVDLRTADMNLDRFTRTFDTDPARKKYNAALRIVKEAEILIALGNLYRGMVDDLVVRNMRNDLAGTEAPSQSVQIGPTSVSEGGTSAATRTLQDLLFLAENYNVQGLRLLGSLKPPSIRLHRSGDFVESPRFTLPFNGF